MHPGNQPPYFQAPWVCQPSRLNACNTVSCPETYTCMEALGPDGEITVRARHVTLWKAANDQFVADPIATTVIPTMPMPVVQKSSVSWICLRCVATNIIRSMVRLLGSVSRSLYASPSPCLSRRRTEVPERKTCQIAACDGDCNDENACTGDDCTARFECVELTEPFSVGYQCDPTRGQCEAGLECRQSRSLCFETTCPNGEPGCATREMNYFCHYPLPRGKLRRHLLPRNGSLRSRPHVWTSSVCDAVFTQAIVTHRYRMHVPMAPPVYLIMRHPSAKVPVVETPPA